MYTEPFNWTFILTHNRHELLEECVRLIAPQTDALIIYDNASDPAVRTDWGSAITVMRDMEQPPNIAKMWNFGWDYIERAMRMVGFTQWNVAMLCDDVMVPDDWYARVAGFMRDTGAAAGSAHHDGTHRGYVKTFHDGDLRGRMHGAAYVVRGELNLRADESMHWWWCDTDIDWQARLAGGMAIAHGAPARNTRPNDFTNTKPELGAQTGQDGAAFTAKWGRRPW